MNLLFRTLNFFSSYIPLIILIFINAMEKLSLCEVERVFLLNSKFWIISLIISIISFFAILLWISSMKKEAKSNGKKYTYKNFNNLKSKDADVLNYFATYIIPLLSLDIESQPSILMNLLLIIIVGIYFIRNNALHYNILLIIFGYYIYSDENDYIIITRKKLYEIKNNSLEADQIGTSNIFFI